MFVALPGFLGLAGGTVYPPYGTLITSQCSGYSAHDSGSEEYTDALGNPWTGMFTLWQELADGAGGSFWQNGGDGSYDEFSTCWLPEGYCTYNDSGDSYVYWDGCGSSDAFGPYGYYYTLEFSDGAGGTYGDSGGGYYSPPDAGDIIYQSGEYNCCTVYYDGAGGYYIEDYCGGGE